MVSAMVLTVISSWGNGVQVERVYYGRPIVGSKHTYGANVYFHV
jgi:hypothetical protein